VFIRNTLPIQHNNCKRFFRRLRNTNDRRILLDVKIAKGTATRLDMMTQLKVELRIFDAFLKNVEVSLYLLYYN